MSMSPATQIALVLLPIVLPLFISLAAILYQRLLQKLPERQRVEIDQVVHTVVSAMEQASNTRRVGEEGDGDGDGKQDTGLPAHLRSPGNPLLPDRGRRLLATSGQ